MSSKVLITSVRDFEFVITNELKKLESKNVIVNKAIKALLIESFYYGAEFQNNKQVSIAI